MGYYQLGLSVDRSRTLQLTPYQRGIRIGLIPGYASMGEVSRAMSLLNREIRSANQEMFAVKITDRESRENDPKFAEFYLGPWSDFYTRWAMFYEGNSGWWERFTDTNDVWNRTQQFRKEYLGFRNIAEKLGYDWMSPDPERPDPEKHGLLREGRDTVDEFGKSIKDAMWAILKFGIIGGAIFLIFMFVAKQIG